MSVSFGNQGAATKKARVSEISTPLQGRRLFLSFSLFGPEKNEEGFTGEVNGTCVVSSDCGTASYSCKGSVDMTLIDGRFSIQDLSVRGDRLSGFDAGELLLAARPANGVLEEGGKFRCSVAVAYSDANNQGLTVDATVSGTVEERCPIEFQGEGVGEGFCFASFLADGETLDEESQDADDDDGNDGGKGS